MVKIVYRNRYVVKIDVRLLGQGARPTLCARSSYITPNPVHEHACTSYVASNPAHEHRIYAYICMVQIVYTHRYEVKMVYPHSHQFACYPPAGARCTPHTLAPRLWGPYAPHPSPSVPTPSPACPSPNP